MAEQSPFLYIPVRECLKAERSDYKDIIKQINENRNRLKLQWKFSDRLKTLEELCLQFLARNTDRAYPFVKLAPPLLTKVSNEIFKYGSTSVSPMLIDNLMNTNLRKFSLNPLMKHCTKESADQCLQKCLELFKRCPFLAKFEIPEVNKIKGEESFIEREISSICFSTSLVCLKNLEELTVHHMALRCDQVEALPDHLPLLRRLEFRVTQMMECCQRRLGQLQRLEALHVATEAEHACRLDWSPLLAGATMLMELETWKSNRCGCDNPGRLPCLMASLQSLKDLGHQQPLQLERVRIRGQFCQTEPPFYLLAKVTNLMLEDLSAHHVYAAVGELGANLNHLKINYPSSSMHVSLDMMQLASLCPKLEELSIACDEYTQSTVQLPPGHFAKLQSITMYGCGRRLPPEFYQRVLESPELSFCKLFSTNREFVELLADHVSNCQSKGIFKKLRRLEVSLMNVTGEDAPLFAATLVSLIAASPLSTVKMFISPRFRARICYLAPCMACNTIVDYRGHMYGDID